jgi:hypothetical protein
LEAFEQRKFFGSWRKPNSEKEKEKVLLAEKAVSRLETRVLEDCPVGYPRTAAFLSSQPNLSTYRAFNYLHSRTLLHKQRALEILEQELDDLDEMDACNETGKRKLKDCDYDKKISYKKSGRCREDVFNDVHKALIEYDELMLKAKEILALPKPSKRDYRNVRAFFYNTKPLVEGQSIFIERKEDVISLRTGREWTNFDSFVESSLKKFDVFDWNKVSYL